MGSGFSMNSLQLSEDENVLLVGTQTGDVSLPHYFACPANLHACMQIVVCGCVSVLKERHMEEQEAA